MATPWMLVWRGRHNTSLLYWEHYSYIRAPLYFTLKHYTSTTPILI
jgi:hypothetical protein